MKRLQRYTYIYIIGLDAFSFSDAYKAEFAFNITLVDIFRYFLNFCNTYKNKGAMTLSRSSCTSDRSGLKFAHDLTSSKEPRIRL